jgi:HSP20 family protein
MATLIRRNHTDQTDQTPTRRQTHDQMLHPYQVMNALLGWNPFRDESPLDRGRGFSPALEIRETKDAYVLKADIPGVKDSDIDLTVTGSEVTIAGRRDPDNAEDGAQFFAMERGYGAFSRTFAVSDGADLEGLTADLSNGVLTLRIPKRPEVQPRKISLGKGDGGRNPSA